MNQIFKIRFNTLSTLANQFSLAIQFLTVILIGASYAYASPFSTWKTSGKYLGVGTCSSSNCHGSATPRNTYSVHQNEYITWQKKDKHSGAWEILTNEDSKRIGHHLGIKSPEKDPLCLKCHATYVPSEANQGEKYRVEDGVSCEACHGPAEKWIDNHTEKDATHSRNLELGLFDIVSSEKRATLCLSCHYGSDDSYVGHRLIGAGHPRLSFELDTYGMLQPKHWDVDKDYETRKEAYSPAKTWLIGQSVLAEASIDSLLSTKRSKMGSFPELTLFNCYACHHSLTEKQWKSREYDGRPGELRLNLSSVTIVEEALAVINPSLSERVSNEKTQMIDSFHSGDGSESAKTLKATLKGEVLPALSKATLSTDSLKKLLTRLVTFGSSGKDPYYETLEQVAMGISALVSDLSPEGGLYEKEIANLYKSLGNPEAFDPALFINASKDMGRAIAR